MAARHSRRGRDSSTAPEHPLLSMNLTSAYLPSDLSYPSLRPAEDDLAPPSGRYKPFFSPDKSQGSSQNDREVGTGSGAAATAQSSWVQEANSAMLADGVGETAEDEPYQLLLERVNEALGLPSPSIQGQGDLEASLLHKVEEVLSALGPADDARTTQTSFLHGREFLSTISGQSSQYFYEPQLSLDLSLADGTYKWEGGESRDGIDGIRLRLNEQDLAVGRSRQDASLDGLPKFEMPRNHHDNSSNSVLPRPSAAPGPMDFPKIEYESFVEDDSLVERALAPLLAKYLPPELLPKATSKPSLQPTRSPSHASATGQVASPIPRFQRASLPQTYSVGSTPSTTATSSVLDPSSVNFEDQLSLASLEYLRRHQLVGSDAGEGESSGIIRVGGRGYDARGPPNRANRGTGPMVRNFGVGRSEQMTRVLDVESIRRLPKLGMPKD
ncbi:hypothetical protein HK104_002924 [Borealophlyctis nickersoniae]|nr:hypothetical protein HK104_002924 [Borealophlyctis nickersoniae]